MACQVPHYASISYSELTTVKDATDRTIYSMGYPENTEQGLTPSTILILAPFAPIYLSIYLIKEHQSQV